MSGININIENLTYWLTDTPEWVQDMIARGILNLAEKQSHDMAHSAYPDWEGANAWSNFRAAIVRPKREE